MTSHREATPNLPVSGGFQINQDIPLCFCTKGFFKIQMEHLRSTPYGGVRGASC